MWKDFFYFTRTEKRAVILLSIILFVLVIYRFLPDTSAEKFPSDIDFEKEYTDFMASINEKENKATTHYPDYKEAELTIQLTSFDPNLADSITFIRLGLTPRIAGNIIRYRSRGGKFRKPEDFRKIYGLTEEKFTELLPYIFISIDDEFIPQTDTDSVSSVVVAANRDTVPRIYKYPAGTVINLNEADTTELKKIPGIGSVTAKRIINYRNRLGGFYDISQLQDSVLKLEEFSGWFITEPSQIIPVNLNKISIERLRNHPYFNFYQAKAIVELRKKKGPIKSLDELVLLEEFSRDDLERMKHYVSFE